MAGAGKSPKKRELSPEVRNKLSELAKKRHAEGKFGGSQYGKLGGRGNTREKRLAAQAVADHASAEETQQAIVQVLKDAVDPSQPIAVRIKGVETIVGIEKENRKIELAQQSAQEQQRSREELLDLLSEKLRQGPVAGILRRQLDTENIVDAEVVDEEETDEPPAAA